MPIRARKTRTIRNVAAKSRVQPKDFVPRRSKQVIARKNSDGTIAIMHLEKEDYLFALDGIAAEFWSLIDDKRTLSQIKQKLIRKHAPPLKRFQSDVEKLVRGLRRADLLVVR